MPIYANVSLLHQNVYQTSRSTTLKFGMYVIFGRVCEHLHTLTGGKYFAVTRIANPTKRNTVLFYAVKP